MEEKKLYLNIQAKFVFRQRITFIINNSHVQRPMMVSFMVNLYFCKFVDLFCIINSIVFRSGLVQDLDFGF